MYLSSFSPGEDDVCIQFSMFTCHGPFSKKLVCVSERGMRYDVSNVDAWSCRKDGVVKWLAYTGRLSR